MAGTNLYLTGKESALHILRETFSVRSLMEDGQLQLLVHHVRDFVNNYTADVLKWVSFDVMPSLLC
jgi:hypothetical protein